MSLLVLDEEPTMESGKQTRAAADVPMVTAMRDTVEHLLPMLAHAPSPKPKNNRQPEAPGDGPLNSGQRSQYGFDVPSCHRLSWMPRSSPGHARESQKSAKEGKACWQAAGKRPTTVGSYLQVRKLSSPVQLASENERGKNFSPVQRLKHKPGIVCHL
jgi:hypothetical protein